MMKNLISIITVAIISTVLIAACSGRNKTESDTQQQQTTEDSIIANDPEVPEIIRGRVVEDTIVGRWTIKSIKDSNDVIIALDNWSVRDSSVFLTVLYDNKIVFDNKEIRTKYIAGSDGKYALCDDGEVFWVSDSALYLTFSCYIPDSDVGWYVRLQILPDGTSNLIDIEDELGVEGFHIVANFLAMYLNERAINASADDLNRLIANYCTEDITKDLSTGNILIASDCTDFRRAYRTSRIDYSVDYTALTAEKYPFHVEFNPDSIAETIDTVYIEVDAALNKISKIETGKRRLAQDSIAHKEELSIHSQP